MDRYFVKLKGDLLALTFYADNDEALIEEVLEWGMGEIKKSDIENYWLDTNIY